MVIQMNWRQDEEDFIIKQSKSKGLCFGVMKSDGQVNPQPPILRAIDEVVEALKREGHNVIEWEPPSHVDMQDWIFKTWGYDGGRDVHGAFGLSGETPAPQITMVYKDKPDPNEASSTDIAAVNVQQRQTKKLYMDYWNSTAKLTGTGRPVDGIIAPLAPYPAARPENYKYYGLSVWVNGLDYTSVVVPVTNADKTKDKYPEGYKPIGDADKIVYDNYDAEIYDGAHCSLQIVGRRLQEERMLAVAEYVGGLIGR